MNFKDLLKNLVLILVSITVVFFVAEIGFRIYSNFVYIYDIEMYKYAKKLKQRSNYPGLSHEHIPKSEADLMHANIKINNLGFRDNDFNADIDQDAYKILFIGSSITMGWGVPYDSVFTTLLEKQINENSNHKILIINSGIGNYNTVLESTYLKKIYDEVKPQLVVLHYFLNDSEIIEKKNANFLIKNSYLIAYIYVKIKETLAVNKYEFEDIGDYYKHLYLSGSKGWKDAQNAIIDIKKYCKENACDFIVLIQPDLHNFDYDSGQFYCHELIHNFLYKNSIDYYDLFDDFARSFSENPTDLWVNPDDPHPNTKGHYLMFEKSYDFISNSIRYSE